MSEPPVTVTRTYLEMIGHDRLAGAELPDGARVRRVDPCPPELYRRLYRETGAAYHWRDRWHWSDDRIRQHLEQPSIRLFVLEEHGETAGWFELATGAGGDVEIAYFGLLPGRTGRGLGKALLTRAVRQAWAQGAHRVWLHTCTLDDPAALPNYLHRGFLPFKEEQYSATLAD